MLTDPFGFIDPRNPRSLTPPEGYEDVHLPGMSWPIAGDRRETTSHISPAQWSQILAQFRALLFITGVDLSDLDDASPYILREALVRAVVLLTPSPAGAWLDEEDYAVQNIVTNDGSAYIATAAHTAAAATEPGVGADWATVWQLLVAKGDQGDQGDPGPQGDPGDMDTLVYDPDEDGKVLAADEADSVPWAGVTDKPDTLLHRDASQALEVGFPDAPQDWGTKAGSVAPAIATGHNQYCVFDGVTVLGLPTDYGSMALGVTIGASQSGNSVDLSAYGSNVFGDDLTDIAGDKFTLWIHRGQTRSSIVIEADAGNA